MEKGYKVTNPDYTCRNFKYELGEIYKHDGPISMCNEGFHFCKKAQDCFNYYSFSPSDKVFEVEASGNVIHGEDKSVCSEIKLVRELTWLEVLELVNAGKGNTGLGNSGYGNSGNWNSGNRNSGDSNSGNWNSGYGNSGNWNSGNRNSGDSNSGNRNSGYGNSGDWNSGNRNSGDSNSGDGNSGNWNSGNRNSGDSNSGYRNSGAFCTDTDPVLYLFNKPSSMTVKEWEQSEACSLMYNIDPTIWVPSDMMSKEEKERYPQHETTGGYLKTISMHEAWRNFWGNLSEDKKKVFTGLENFDPKIFKEITGIDI